ncbi:MAG TPA: glycosyltransferase family 1 protein [Roseiflexaceae bacterium]|nr:glycosyltransferase family 1 protein [Roseiflexaceae bacterium]
MLDMAACCRAHARPARDGGVNVRIGFDISVLRIANAGVLTYTRNLLNALVAQGDTYTLLDVLPLNPHRPMRPIDAFAAENARLVRCGGLPRGYLSALPPLRHGLPHRLAELIDRALDRPWEAAAIGVLGLQLRTALRGIAVFHGSDQFWYAPPGGASVMTFHDLTYRVEPAWHVAENTSMHHAKETFAMTRATRLIAVSHATRDDLVRFLGIDPARIRVVYEAADPSFSPSRGARLDDALARYGLRPGGYLLSVGTLEPRKNYIRLIEAYARLQTRHPDVPPLVIAGGQGWHFADILAAPERAGVAGRVRFLGRVADEDLPLIYAGATLFVYPSLYEGFGLPILEALACGVPVVAANTSSIPEVIGDAGLLCEPYDVTSITAALERLLADPHLAARLRAAGPPHARRFSWERAARETLAVYAEAADAIREQQHTRRRRSHNNP